MTFAMKCILKLLIVNQSVANERLPQAESEINSEL
jgi:hypothetical protein